MTETPKNGKTKRKTYQKNGNVKSKIDKTNFDRDPEKWKNNKNGKTKKRAGGEFGSADTTLDHGPKIERRRNRYYT